MQCIGSCSLIPSLQVQSQMSVSWKQFNIWVSRQHLLQWLQVTKSLPDFRYLAEMTSGKTNFIALLLNSKEKESFYNGGPLAKSGPTLHVLPLVSFKIHKNRELVHIFPLGHLLLNFLWPFMVSARKCNRELLKSVSSKKIFWGNNLWNTYCSRSGRLMFSPLVMSLSKLLAKLYFGSGQKEFWDYNQPIKANVFENVGV